MMLCIPVLSTLQSTNKPLTNTVNDVEILEGMKNPALKYLTDNNKENHLILASFF